MISEAGRRTGQHTAAVRGTEPDARCGQPDGFAEAVERTGRTASGDCASVVRTLAALSVPDMADRTGLAAREEDS